MNNHGRKLLYANHRWVLIKIIDLSRKRSWVYKTKTIQANRSPIMNGIQHHANSTIAEKIARTDTLVEDCGVVFLIWIGGLIDWLKGSRSGAVYIDGGETGSVRSRVCRTDRDHKSVQSPSRPRSPPGASLAFLFLSFFCLRSWSDIQKYPGGSVIFQWDTNTVISPLSIVLSEYIKAGYHLAGGDARSHVVIHF
jgi:hypothetical protein